MEANPLDAYPSDSDAESRGGDHRPIQDNGTGGATSNTQGEARQVNYALPQDPNAPHADDGDSDVEPMEYGVDESKEVGHAGGVQDYGFGGSAGGGVKRNIKE